MGGCRRRRKRPRCVRWGKKRRRRRRKVCKRLQAKQRRICGRRRGCFIVQCNRDGSFKPMQCHGSTGYCWCVDAKGRKTSRSVNMRGRRRNLRCGGKKGKRKKCPKKLPRNGRCNHKSSLRCNYHPIRCCGRGKKIYTLSAICRRGRWLRMMKMIHCRCRTIGSVCKRV